MTRKPIKIMRTPITLLSEHGLFMGGWYPFAPTEPTPTGIRIRDNERLLYCPYCGTWTLFKNSMEDRDKYECQGWCGWANTREYHVRHANRLFWEHCKNRPTNITGTINTKQRVLKKSKPKRKGSK